MSVESSRAKVLRQRRDFAPQWVKASPPSDLSSATYGETKGQTPMTIPQTTTTFSGGNASPVVISRKDEAERSVFEVIWNQPPAAYKHTGRVNHSYFMAAWMYVGTHTHT